MRRLASTMALVALLPAVVTASIWAVIGDSGSLALAVLVQMSIMGIAAAVTLYLLNLPFMLLAFNSPFYRARFHALFCPEKPAL